MLWKVIDATRKLVSKTGDRRNLLKFLRQAFAQGTGLIDQFFRLIIKIEDSHNFEISQNAWSESTGWCVLLLQDLLFIEWTCISLWYHCLRETAVVFLILSIFILKCCSFKFKFLAEMMHYWNLKIWITVL